MTNVCYSGGADGADLLFGRCAEEKGHSVIHWHFDPKKSKLKNHSILSKEQLEFADPYLKWANRTLQRGTFPYSNAYTNNLLRRNFYQVYPSDSLYAATRFADGKPLGGTAWAIQMFIDKYKGRDCPCYVYNLTTSRWYTYNGDGWRIIHNVPKPTGRYAGIGSRELTENGIKAIMDLYQ